MKKKFFFILRIAVTSAILFALFKFIPYKQLIEVYADSNKVYIVFTFLIFFFSQFIGIVRWRFLLCSLGLKVSLREAFYSLFCGLFFNLFFPSFVAGDVFRGFSISHRHGSAKKVATSVLMDRFSGAVALAIVALASFLFLGGVLRNNKEVIFAVFFLCAVILLSFLIIFSRRFFHFLIKILKERSPFRQKLVSFHDQLYFFKENPAIFIKSLIFSLVIQTSFPAAWFIASKAFGVDVGIGYFFMLVPIIMAIALVPITIAGAGTREASAVYFFSFLGIEKSIGLGISLLNLVFMVFMGIAGGIFYVTVYHRWLQPRS